MVHHAEHGWHVHGGMCHEQQAAMHTASRHHACTRYGATVHSDRLCERAGNDARWLSCDFAYQVCVQMLLRLCLRLCLCIFAARPSHTSGGGPKALRQSPSAALLPGASRHGNGSGAMCYAARLATPAFTGGPLMGPLIPFSNCAAGAPIIQ
jgi:hypothetical protein